MRRGEGVGGSAQILDAPTENLEHHHTTQQRNATNDTPHNTTVGPAQGALGWARGVPRKEVHGPNKTHEQQIVPNRSPIGQCFSGSRMVRKGLCTKRCDEKERSGAKAVCAKNAQKNQKTWKKTKSKKKEKKKISFPFQTKKSKKKINNKSRKMKEDTLPFWRSPQCTQGHEGGLNDGPSGETNSMRLETWPCDG